jgi:hypothetical protein
VRFSGFPAEVFSLKSEETYKPKGNTSCLFRTNRIVCDFTFDEAINDDRTFQHNGPTLIQLLRAVETCV